MFRYFNEIVVCRTLTDENKLKQQDINRLNESVKGLEKQNKGLEKQNKGLEKQNKGLEKQNKDLIYKYDGLLLSNREIYEKYQNTILKK
jgi:hypothetical protein